MATLTIGNDRMAAIAVSGLDTATKMIESPTERLTTGRRINSASDDAAGSAMISRLGAQILSVKAAAANNVETMSMLDQAESALDSVSDMLLRIREIAIQASSSSLSSADRTSLIDEKGLLAQEIARISDATAFNGQKLLDGNLQAHRAQLGAGANDYAQISLATTNPDYLGAYLSTGPTRAALTAAIGTSASDQLNTTTDNEDIVLTASGTSFTVNVAARDSAKTVATKVNNIASATLVSADAMTYAHLSTTDGSATTYTLSLNGVSTSSFSMSSSDVSGAVTAINLISGSTGVTAAATTDSKVLLFDADGDDITIENSASGTGLRVVAVERDQTSEVTGTISLQASGNNDTTRVIGTLRLSSENNFEISQSGTANLGYATTGSPSLSSLSAVSFADAASSSEMLAIIDASLQQVTNIIGDVGAFGSLLDFNLEGQYSNSTVLALAKTNISAADFAVETALLAKALVLQKSSAAVLAQANASADLVLTLLEDAA